MFGPRVPRWKVAQRSQAGRHSGRPAWFQFVGGCDLAARQCGERPVACLRSSSAGRLFELSEHTDAQRRVRNSRGSQWSLADRELPSAASLTPFLSPRWGWETSSVNGHLKWRKTNALETPARLWLRALNVSMNGPRPQPVVVRSKGLFFSRGVRQHTGGGRDDPAVGAEPRARAHRWAQRRCPDKRAADSARVRRRRVRSCSLRRPYRGMVAWLRSDALSRDMAPSAVQGGALPLERLEIYRARLDLVHHSSASISWREGCS